ERLAYDVGSHRLHEDNHPAVNQLIHELCGRDLLKRERKGLIFLQDRPLRYPPSAFDVMTAFGVKKFSQFFAGFLRAHVLRLMRGNEPENFEDYTISRVGKSLYKRFYKPYAVKLYGMSPRQITKDPAISRVRKFNLPALLRDAKHWFTGK